MLFYFTLEFYLICRLFSFTYNFTIFSNRPFLNLYKYNFTIFYNYYIRLSFCKTLSVYIINIRDSFFLILTVKHKR